ncbi:MAG: DUF1579 domain-containing protein, partial [Isosphaeraceae bacterium]
GGAGLRRVAVGQAVPQPTPEHERLAKIVGTWDATVKSWMQGPDQEPTVSKGVETVKLMPGGLWALSEFHGKFGELDFHGAGQSGYDPAKKKYVGTWVDSMETTLTIMEGDFDPQTKTLTMHSQGKGPGGTPYEMKTTEVYKDHAHRVFMMFMKFGESKNEYVKMMEISYVRRAEEGAKK